MVIEGLYYGAIFLISIASVVYWIVAIIEVAHIPEWQFRAADSNKNFWLFVIVFMEILGALLWLFVRRQSVLAAVDAVPTAAPGWYPDPEAGADRWWNGIAWTDRYDTWSGDLPR